jgi:hypothetical protein
VSIPPPELLSILSTIIVHPLFTHRVNSPARAEASRSALRLLQDITDTVGPVNACYSEAFVFRSDREQRRLSRHQSMHFDADSDDSSEGNSKGPNWRYATTDSVCGRADDCWAVVGWAFNCLYNNPKRWEYWRLWLGWYIDALEKDWQERLRLAAAILETTGDARKAKQPLLKSMIFGSLLHNTSRSAGRRILRAILTDGVNQKPLNEFKEIWMKETKERKVSAEEEPEKEFNLEEDKWGAYDIDYNEDKISDGEPDGSQSESRPSEDDTEESTHKSRRTPKDIFEIGTAKFGGVDALKFRLRLIALLASVAMQLHDDFTSGDSMFDLYTEVFRELAPELFAALVSNRYLSPQEEIALMTNHLMGLAQVPLPVGGIFRVGTNDILKHLMPAKASSQSAAENLKVSLAVEVLLKRLVVSSAFEPLGYCAAALERDALGAAVRAGIKTREDRVGGDGRRKRSVDGQELAAREELKRSSKRILLLLSVASVT